MQYFGDGAECIKFVSIILFLDENVNEGIESVARTIVEISTNLPMTSMNSLRLYSTVWITVLY